MALTYHDFLEVFMNSIKRETLLSKDIIYINDTPYYVGNLKNNYLVKLGYKGDKITSAAFWPSDSSIRGQSEIGFKVVNNAGFQVFADSQSVFIEEDVIGGLYRPYHGVVFVRPDGEVLTYALGDFSPTGSYRLEQVDGIKNYYAPSGKHYAILQDNKNRLFLWSGGVEIAGGSVRIPGSKVNHIFYDVAPQSFSYYYFVLTDEGLYNYHNSKALILPYLTENSIASVSHSLLSHQHQIVLPESIDIDNIKDITTVPMSNLFLLTNDGKVYSIGKNGYYQRGTSKKLKIDEWNEIKYPEKIKQIASTITYPGLFALSENGNLYYHGYNGEGYYPITNRRSSIGTPLKIAEDITSVLSLNIKIYPPDRSGKTPLAVDPVFITDNEGELAMIPVKFLERGDYDVFTSGDKMYIPSFYKTLAHDLIHTPNSLKALLEVVC